MTHCDITSAMAGKPLILSLKSRFVKKINKCMSCGNDVKTIALFVLVILCHVLAIIINYY